MLENLDELRVFVQVADGESLTSAARTLGVSPNTASRRLAALEERLGTRLVYRTTRSSSLSDAGKTLLVHARRILAAAAAAEAELSQDDALAGLIRVSVPTMLPQMGLLKPLHALLAAHPRLRVQLRVTDQPINPIAEGLELSVQVGELRDSGLLSRKLGEARMVLAASPRYAAARGLPAVASELSQHEALCFLGDRPQSHWLLHDSDGGEHIIPVQGRLESDDSRTLNDALYAGHGIGYMMPAERARAIREGTIVAVLPGYLTPPYKLFAVFSPARRGSARLRTLIEILQAVVRTAQQDT